MTAYGRGFVVRLGVREAGDGRDASSNCYCLGTTATSNFRGHRLHRTDALFYFRYGSPQL